MSKEAVFETKAPNYITHVQAIGVYERFDFYLSDLKPGINILHGENGSGKTTLLHIIANAINNDYQRFIYLPFNQIKIEFDNRDFVEIRRTGDKDLHLWRSDKRRRVKLFGDINDEAITPNSVDEYDLSTLRFRNYEPLITAAYFPAFRTMIEAWHVLDEIGREDQINNMDTSTLSLCNSWQVKATHFAREIFGHFTPNLNYLSLFDIEAVLVRNFTEARQRLLNFNQEILSSNFSEALLAVLSPELSLVMERSNVILEDIKKLLEEIRIHPLQGNSSLTSGIYKKLQEMVYSLQEEDSLSEIFTSKILGIYRDSLQAIVAFQEKEFREISRYINSVNELLIGKKIEISWQALESNFSLLKLVFDDKAPPGNINLLSSGERQVFTLMYAIASISSQKVVLIDEPEMSIHIDAQSKLLKSMSDLLENKQIIVCTHSPRIAGKQRDRLMEVKPQKTDRGSWVNDFDKDDEDCNFYEIEDEFFE